MKGLFIVSLLCLIGTMAVLGKVKSEKDAGTTARHRPAERPSSDKPKHDRKPEDHWKPEHDQKPEDHWKPHHGKRHDDRPKQITDRPVIGILTLPIDGEFPTNDTTYIAGSYVSWVEQGGARVVPLRVDHDWSELEYLVSNLNGVLFTGGSADFWVNGPDTPNLQQTNELTPYAKTGCAILNLVKQFNDRGIYYPVWGTCLGFQLLHICAYENVNTVQSFDGEPPYTQRNQFTRAVWKSRLFGQKPGGYIIDLMANENIQFLSHQHGIAPHEYKQYQNLSESYQILATMKDRNDNTFVSIIEGKKYPIYGTQFHPEKNIYEWNITEPIPHGQNAVLMSSYLSLFFSSETRRNTNQFTTEEELKPWLIYNWEPIFVDGYFTTVFAFD